MCFFSVFSRYFPRWWRFSVEVGFQRRPCCAQCAQNCASKTPGPTRCHGQSNTLNCGTSAHLTLSHPQKWLMSYKGHSAEALVRVQSMTSLVGDNRHAAGPTGVRMQRPGRREIGKQAQLACNSMNITVHSCSSEAYKDPDLQPSATVATAVIHHLWKWTPAIIPCTPSRHQAL